MTIQMQLPETSQITFRIYYYYSIIINNNYNNDMTVNH